MIKLFLLATVLRSQQAFHNIFSAFKDLHTETLKQGAYRSPKAKESGVDKAEKCLIGCIQACDPKHKLENLGYECLISCTAQCYMITSQGEGEKDEQRFGEVDSLPTNYCLNGKNQSGLDYQQILFEFAKGPCSPIMLVPGFAGTKLVVEIDCNLFRLNNPETFTKCGWNACKKNPSEFWKKVPEKEYVLWMPAVDSPLSVLNASKQANLCFAELVTFEVKFNVPVEQMIELKKGVNVSVYGFTPNTREANDCGAAAIANILPFQHQNDNSVYFSTLTASLKRIGYVSGLTMQAMPYNFFYSYEANEFRLNFYPSLQRLRRLTGKKVTIVGHSIGNLNVLYNLGPLNPAEKRRLIFNWAVIAPPFLGSYESQAAFTFGFNLPQSISDEGSSYNFSAARLSNVSLLSLYEMAIKDPFDVFSNQDWFAKVKQRLDYERSFPQIKYEDSGILFWPPLDNDCYDSHLKELKDHRCFINIKNATDSAMMKILGDDYFIKDTQELLNGYALEASTAEIYRKLAVKDLTDIEPGVPVVLIFMSSHGTRTEFEADEQTFKDIKAGLYPRLPLTLKEAGDGWTPTFSALLLPLKWAIRFQDDGDSNNPVKFVEYCGVHSRLTEIYDKKQPGSAYEINSNAYHSITCKCLENGQAYYNDCGYQAMISDQAVIDAIVKVAVGNQQVSEEDLNYIQGLNSKELEDEVNTCSHYAGRMF